MHLGKIKNSRDQPVPLHTVPNPAQANYAPPKNAGSMSYSHNQFPNHFGQTDIQEQFEPTYVKLDKQVSSGSPAGRYTFGACSPLFSNLIIIGPSILRLLQGERR